MLKVIASFIAHDSEVNSLLIVSAFCWFYRSGAEGSRATLSTPRYPRPVCTYQWRRNQRPFVPLKLHLTTSESGTVPDLQIRPVYAAQQYHGYRQYLRTRRETAIQCRRMGSQYSLLPGSSSDGSSSALTTCVERTVRTECIPVFNASSCSTSPSCCGSACLADGCRSCGRLHGSHPYLPGASREIEGVTCRFCRVQLSQSHSALHNR